MKSQNHKFSLSQFLESPLALAISVILFGIILYSVISVILKQEKSQHSKTQAQEELASLEDQKGSLEAEIGLLESDFGREKALREKFGVVKEGEEIIVLVNNEEEGEVKEGDGMWGWISGIFSRN